jgi:hypothetical protein
VPYTRPLTNDEPDVDVNSIASATPENESAAAAAFVIASGGRSGGGGATASWEDGDAPVIVDPFAVSGSSTVDGDLPGSLTAERDDPPADAGEDATAAESDGPSY